MVRIRILVTATLIIELLLPERLATENRFHINPASLVVFHDGPGYFRAFFQREFDGVVGWQLVLLGVSGDGGVIQIT